MQTITADNYEQQIAQNERLVVLKFSTSWCQPCKIIRPRLAAVEALFAEQITVGEVDSEDEPELAQKFDVSVVPVVLLLRKGTICNRLVGIVTEAQLKDAINAAL